jgi:hypothetical protein
MKKITLTLILLCSILSHSQDKFTYEENGLTDYVIIKNDSLSQSELYSKTIDWIKDTYENPDEVIKTKFKNEKIRLSGLKIGAFVSSIWGVTHYSNGKYSVEISFKEGRLKFDPIWLKEQSNYGYYDVDIDSNTWIFKKNGKAQQVYKKYPENITSLFNDLTLSLNDYLLKKSNIKEDSSDDW